MAALGAGFFALVFRRLGGRDDVLAALALASVPAYYIVSVQSMDYAWALAFALAALCFALTGRPFVTGALAGLAIGCRVTSGAWLVPLALVLASARPPGARVRTLVTFVGSALVIGALAYLPSYLASGTGFFRFYDHGNPGALFVVRSATVDLWGVPGALALLIAVPLALRGAWRAPAAAAIVLPRRGLLTGAWCLGLGLFVVAFLQLPYKPAYLVPAIPLVLLLLGQWLRRRVFVAVCVALVASPWILGVGPPDLTAGLFPSTSPRTFHLSGHTFVLDWLHGPILRDQATRRHQVQYVGQSLARARRLRGECVVVAWDWLPQIKVRQGGDSVGSVRFVYLLTPDEMRELRARRSAIYHLVGADWADEHAYGVSLRQNGSRSLDALE
jgi:hypothetical protein